MKTLTLKIDEETLDELDDEVEERGYSSRSEYLRKIIEKRHEVDEVREEYEKNLEKLRNDLDHAEARADDLRRQLEARGNVEEKVEEIAERQERQDEALAEVLREQRRGVLSRAKLWLFGESRGDDNDREGS
ncbi:MAG: ribbon-helix-helix domain-containing protein [Halobacteria archaeon]|nr:ribbon-helix-helix domain-containing protein [Halobacteria archaeon]